MHKRKQINFFWDIDGTILDTYGLGKKPFNIALSRFFNRTIDISYYNFAGFTDYEIIQFFASKYEYAVQDFEMEFILELYCAEYHKLTANQNIMAFDHVKKFLSYEHHDYIVAHGIASGNCRGGGQLKLESSGLKKFFHSQLFFASSEFPTRDELITFVSKTLGDSIVLIGDTPRDYYSAIKNGLRIISVATGSFSFEQLSALNPGFVLDKSWSVNEMRSLMHKLARD